MSTDHVPAATLQLVIMSLTPGHPYADACARELRQRWHRTAMHRISRPAWRDRPGQLDGGLDPAVEDARLVLGVYTLIYESWVLQQAGVAPADLYTDLGAPPRVVGVLQRELRRTPGRFTDDGTIEGEPDPLAEAGRDLAHWVQLALFAEIDSLTAEHTWLAGTLPDLRLDELHVLCSRALAELRGPWQLDARLAAPEIGKVYWRPRHPARPDAFAGRAVTLGLPDSTVTHEHVRRSREQVDAEVTAEIGRLSVTRLPPPRVLDTARFSGPDRQHVAARLRPTAEFLADALGVVRLAVDHTARIDGRPVAPTAYSRIVDWHVMAAAHRSPEVLPTTRIDISGLRIGFVLDETVDLVVADLDAAGTHHRVDLGDLDDILATLHRADAITTIAKTWLWGELYEDNTDNETPRTGRWRAAHRHAITAAGRPPGAVPREAPVDREPGGSDGRRGAGPSPFA